MKNFFYAFLALLVCSFLLGCEETKEVKTIEHYLSHEAELDVKLKECRDNPDELKKTPECINAEAANYKRYVL